MSNGALLCLGLGPWGWGAASQSWLPPLRSWMYARDSVLSPELLGRVQQAVCWSWPAGGPEAERLHLLRMHGIEDGSGPFLLLFAFAQFCSADRTVSEGLRPEDWARGRGQDGSVARRH